MAMGLVAKDIRCTAPWSSVSSEDQWLEIALSSDGQLCLVNLRVDLPMAAAQRNLGPPGLAMSHLNRT
jgi:hypothetical protein